MNQADTIRYITELVTPLAVSLNLSIWGIEIAGSGRPIARVYVDVLSHTESKTEETADREEPYGVTVDQCAELSRLVGLALDVEGPFVGSWTLEISSPGLERPFFTLDQLRNYVGCDVDAALRAPLPTWPGRKNFSGALVRVGEDDFTLNLPPANRLIDDPEQATLPWSIVHKVHLVHHFTEPLKPGKSINIHDSKGTRGGSA